MEFKYASISTTWLWEDEPIPPRTNDFYRKPPLSQRVIPGKPRKSDSTIPNSGLQAGKRNSFGAFRDQGGVLPQLLSLTGEVTFLQELRLKEIEENRQGNRSTD
jgi:hypothetical protein